MSEKMYEALEANSKRANQAEQDFRQLAALTSKLLFFVETVAHLHGQEREMLPVCDKARELIAMRGE